jgi:hypothetical protein
LQPIPRLLAVLAGCRLEAHVPPNFEGSAIGAILCGIVGGAPGKIRGDTNVALSLA